MNTLRIYIDGIEVNVDSGKTVLEVALENNIYIPHLCYHPDLKPLGACRLCVVEIEGTKGVLTACTTTVKEGMKIKTKSSLLERLRVMAMELMLAGHPPDCTTCPKYLNCELQSLKQYLGITEELRVHRKVFTNTVNTSNPLFTHDFQRCILCGRCVRACYELRGVGVLSYLERGSNTRIGTVFDKNLIDSECVFCGTCVEVCPTAAIRDKEDIIDPKKGKKASLIPCKYNCPGEIDVPRYIRYIRHGKYGEALATVREKAPLPLVLGYVCNHPCETKCRRNYINDAISIKNLKRFAAEHDDLAWMSRVRRFPSTGKRIAIIGSGPAGLTAAYYLDKLGHQITIFEAYSQLGGMLRVGIPEYRLPKKVLDEEISRIISPNTEVKLNSKVESLGSINSGYDAILIAVGTHKGQRLPIPGNNLNGVFISTEFLRDVNLKNRVTIGNKVLILGGGNVAFDCARVAKRLGAAEVFVACLECREKMLASEEEINQAIEEGIVIYNSKNFLRIVGSENKVVGVECIEVKDFAFDEEGKLQIETIPSTEHILPADTVIFAIGQIADIPEGFKLDLGRGNRIIVEEHTQMTSITGVFAAGDAIYGTASVIEAIASGRKAAIYIDKYLGGTGSIEDELVQENITSNYIGRKDNFATLKRTHSKIKNAKERIANFVTVEDSMSELEAIQEANRCLQCDMRFNIKRIKFWADYLSQ